MDNLNDHGFKLNLFELQAYLDPPYPPSYKSRDYTSILPEYVAEGETTIDIPTTDIPTTDIPTTDIPTVDGQAVTPFDDDENTGNATSALWKKRLHRLREVLAHIVSVLPE